VSKKLPTQEPRPRTRAALTPLREQIDRLDSHILTLLNRRARLAQRIGRSKRQDGASVYVPEREQQVFARLAQLNQGPLPDKAIQAIYREIISASRSLEQPLRIAYLGPEATFTHMAARERFGSQAVFVPLATIPQVFAAVEHGEANYGVVPIENSTEGAVAITLDMLVESNLHIIAEVSLEIHHCLLSRATQQTRIKRVLAHPQALAQCRRWLSTNLPHAVTEEVASNARAAQQAATNAETAAIASRLAAEHYRLNVLAENIQDQAANFTRFATLGRAQHRTQPSGHDRTSFVLSVRDEVGVLYRTLKPFADHTINLLRIESRPLKGRPWEYLFFIDVAGHVQDAPLVRVLREIEPLCSLVKVLGSYAAADCLPSQR
jgi:chorismate mutase / prephenate dehydratase